MKAFTVRTKTGVFISEWDTETPARIRAVEEASDRKEPVILVDNVLLSQEWVYPSPE